jgi:type IV pilus biogenesis protein CpaD/CtpE
MKRLIILAVAASLVGCHSRSNEAAGAAPDRGDTTATHVVDPTAPARRVPPAGRVGPR